MTRSFLNQKSSGINYCYTMYTITTLILWNAQDIILQIVFNINKVIELRYPVSKQYLTDVDENSHAVRDLTAIQYVGFSFRSRLRRYCGHTSCPQIDCVNGFWMKIQPIIWLLDLCLVDLLESTYFKFSQLCPLKHLVLWLGHPSQLCDHKLKIIKSWKKNMSHAQLFPFL